MKKILYIFLALAMISFVGCTDDQDETGTLDVRFKLMYNDTPLQMFTEYDYPDGRAMNFTRFSMYTSELSIGSEVLSAIDFHNLTSNNATSEGAEAGYSWVFNDVKSGDYTNLSFDIGIPADMNAMTPEDFETGHPLAKLAEYWFGWASYVFVKAEGTYDDDNDSTTEEKSFALHLGADEAFNSISLAKDIVIKDDATTVVEVEIDIYEFLGGIDNTYDIDTNPQIHTPNQQDQVVELTNNLKNAIR